VVSWRRGQGFGRPEINSFSASRWCERGKIVQVYSDCYLCCRTNRSSFRAGQVCDEEVKRRQGLLRARAKRAASVAAETLWQRERDGLLAAGALRASDVAAESNPAYPAARLGTRPGRHLPRELPLHRGEPPNQRPRALLRLPGNAPCGCWRPDACADTTIWSEASDAWACQCGPSAKWEEGDTSTCEHQFLGAAS